MKTIINTIKTLQPTRSGMFRASASLALGISLVFVMGLMLPQKAEATIDGYGDCSGCGGTDYYYPTTGGTDYYYPTTGGTDYYYPTTGGTDYYYPTTGGTDYYYPTTGGTDYYYPTTGGTDYYYPTTGGTDYYYPTTGSTGYYYGSSYTQPYYNNYRTDYSFYPNTYSGGGSNYNYNYNNNNVDVHVDGGGDRSCAEIGLLGIYPNCHEREQVRTCADSGLVGTYPNCHQNGDACSNIPGDQPRGYDCNRDRNHDDNVSCDLSVSDSTVEDGDRVTLEWETDGNPNYASINQGIGHVDEDGGDERVEIDGDTTFRMTVRNSSGDEDTCSVTVRVDDNNNFSSVSFVGEPTNNPPVVYLSDIPYTGLEDISPALLSYWLMLIAAAAGGVWFLYVKGMIPTFAFASAEPVEEEVVGDIAEGSGHVTPEVENFLAALQNNDTDKALDYVRDAAHNGTGVEEFLASAESVASDSELQARVSAALAESRNTGIRGVKAVLA